MVSATGIQESIPDNVWIGIDLGTVNSCVSYCINTDVG